jgi:hypothetical protein
MYTLKEIKPQFRSIRPFNLYNEWNFRDAEFTHYSNIFDWTEASASYATSSRSSSKQVSIEPTFPAINVKYARYYDNETGSVTYNDVVDEYGYSLTDTYHLANGDIFCPQWHKDQGIYSTSSQMNPDKTYQRMIYYSLKRLFYGNQAIHSNCLIGTSSVLSNEAFVFEIPQRCIGDTIQPGYFILEDANDINNLPYGNTNTEGIKLIDDSQGNLFDVNSIASESIQRGNIFYTVGIVVITDIEYARYFREYLIISGGVV